MQIHELIHFIKQPKMLGRESIDELEAIEKQHPFFQTIKLLSLKHAYMFDKSMYRSRLENTALYVTDRRILYELIFPLDDPDVFQETGKTGKPVITTEQETGNEIVTSDNVPKAKKNSIQENISVLLKEQLADLKKADPDKEQLVPEIALDISKEYGKPDKLESDPMAVADSLLITLHDENLEVEKDLTAETYI